MSPKEYLAKALPGRIRDLERSGCYFPKGFLETAIEYLLPHMNKPFSEMSNDEKQTFVDVAEDYLNTSAVCAVKIPTNP